jgi:hypothetical protein
MITKNPPVDPILSYFNPLCTSHIISLDAHFNIILLSTPVFPQRLFSMMFANKVYISRFLMRAACPTLLIFLDVIALIILDDDCRL